MNAPATTTPASSPDGGRGKTGLLVLAVSSVLVLGWLGVRIATKVGENGVLAEKRAAAQAQGPKLPTVRTVTATKATWLPRVTVEGTIEAEQRALLAFKVGGRLVHVGARLGDQVKAGQLLGRLDASEAAAQQSAAQAQLQAAQAQFALANDAERRTVELVKGGALAEATGVQAEQQRALAEAQTAAARAQLGLAASSLSNHALVAPFSGTVTRAPNTRGSVVAPGEPLFEIVDASKLRLRGTVTEGDAALLSAGAPVKLEGVPGESHGQIRTVLGVLDPRTRRVPVEADLVPSSAVRVGAFVKGIVTTGAAIDVLRIPGSTLLAGSQDLVLAVENGKLVEKRIVFAVDTESGALLVRSGLRLEDQLVDSPRPEARAGDAVTVESGATPPAK